VHASSMENMQRCIDWYLPPGARTVVDVGAADVNGSYRSLFSGDISYVGLDLEPGPGVDVVQADPYVLPFEEDFADVLITGQMLEHCAHFWRIFSEFARVLRPGGVVFAIAPSAGPVHRYPVDCWRFYPDSFPSLAEWTGLRLVHSWTDERGPWRDLVGVFQKGDTLEQRTEPPAAKPHVSFEELPGVGAGAPRQGQRPYLDVLRDIHSIVSPRTYLEIGVRKGASLRLSQAEVTIGIDPAPDTGPLPDTVALYRCTSDDFFFFRPQSDVKRRIDLAFIDGMHLAEFVLRDFMNVERQMSPSGVIVVDDVLPTDAVQARRTRETQAWTGDVWRFVELLGDVRPDLKLTLLDTAPTGLLLISRLNPRSVVLWREYNPLMRKLQNTADTAPPATVLERKGAIPATLAILRQQLGTVPSSKVASPVNTSLVVGAFDMGRELPRTLFTLSRRFQRETDALRWEVVVVDNGSAVPVSRSTVAEALGDVPFRLVRSDSPSASPAAALNAAVRETRGSIVGLWIDGARLASPGILARAYEAWKADPSAAIATLAFHLGPDQQMRSVGNGYDPAVEDRLLNSIPWREDGYRLFDISVLAGSSERGWFGRLRETNALFVDRDLWERTGGLDTRFATPGGGYVNLDLWERCIVASNGRPWVILGEGTFHQVHGGAATNGTPDARRKMAEEYVAVRERIFQMPTYTPRFIGTLDERRLRTGSLRAAG